MINEKNNFNYVKINLASPEKIREWGQRKLPNGLIVGEVRKPDTINYRTFRPEINGIFCERMFGPIKKMECYCGQYSGFKPKNSNSCENCGVEVTEARIRRHRLGYIELISPVAHIWYLKSIPSYLSLLLKYRLSILENIIYYNLSIQVDKKKDNKKKNLIGAYAIKTMLENLNLNEEIIEARLNLSFYDFNDRLFIKKKSIYKSDIDYKDTYDKLIKRIRLIENFLATKSSPTWMILDTIPVIPAGLRPMLEIDDGNYISSDLNELYRRVITRNVRLSKLLKMLAPTIVIYNEKRLLQEAVDELINNGKSKTNLSDLNERPLKSLSEIIEGKNGRFRQNLLGKRVDYSARSVIIVAPNLKLNQCGIPYEIAFELFEPFIIHELFKRRVAPNMRIAKKILQKKEVIVWKILENILKLHPIILNRAPTLHRLGIQAFQPILVTGRAIQLHPLVCAAFNADFDGDQMAIHLPLSNKSQFETIKLMLPFNNFLSAATGDAIITPTQDMVLGCYYITLDNPKYNNNKNIYFMNMEEIYQAYLKNIILIHTPVWLKIKSLDIITSLNEEKLKNIEEKIDLKNNIKYIKTTVGRVILNRLQLKNFIL